MKIQNIAPYAIDTPASLGPADIADVEETDDIKRLIEAGLIVEVDAKEQKPSVKTKAEDK